MPPALPRLLWLLLGLLLALASAGAAAQAGAPACKLVVGRFSAGDLAGWEEKVFKGHTQYQLVSQDRRQGLKAEAQGSASALIKTQHLDSRQYPLLHWSWKVEATVAQGDERVGRWVSKERDILADYRRLFGGEIGAVVVMTDADNTGGKDVAYYGDISLAPRP